MNWDFIQKFKLKLFINLLVTYKKSAPYFISITLESQLSRYHIAK